MSRRYGRNQRRRAREALAETQLALVETQLQLARALSSGRLLRSQIEEAQRRLGQHTYMMSPQTLRISRDPFFAGIEAIQVTRPEAIGVSIDRFRSGFEWRTKREFIPRDPLPVMLARTKLDRTHGPLHIKVCYGNGQWGYGISPEVFRFEDRDELVRTVAIELAELITHDMQLEGSKVR